MEQYSVKELITNDSFRDWVEGNASNDEIRYWDWWVTISESHRHKASLAQQEILGFFVKESLNREDEAYVQKQRLESRLRKESAAFRKRLDENRFNYTPLYKVAASMVMVISMLFVMHYLLDFQFEADPDRIWNTVSTDHGERKTLTLFDGSEIELNTNSTLKYSTDATKLDTVRFRLDGEAFFSFKIDNDSRIQAFSVYTPEGEIRVLGTEFVVSTGTYGTRVVLEQGSLDILKNASLRNESSAGHIAVRLLEAELAEFSSTMDSIHVEQVNPEVYTSWKEDRFVFDETGFPEVVNRIQRTFNVEVLIQNESLMDRSLTGTVATRELDVLVEYIAQAYQINAIVLEEEGKVYFGRSNQRNSPAATMDLK